MTLGCKLTRNVIVRHFANLGIHLAATMPPLASRYARVRIDLQRSSMNARRVFLMDEGRDGYFSSCERHYSGMPNGERSGVVTDDIRSGVGDASDRKRV